MFLPTVTNVWDKIDTDSPDMKGYVILFGNKHHGVSVTKEGLPKSWKRFAQRGLANYNGDLTLAKDGKRIRSINNYDCKISGSMSSNAGLLAPSQFLYCVYKKFN